MAILPAIASPMHGALVPIGYALANGSTQTFNFSSIPQGYQDLYVVVNGRSTRAVTNEVMLYGVNSDTSTIYSYTWLYGNGSSAGSSRVTASGYFIAQDQLTGTSASSGIWGSGTMHILNYSNSSTYKTFLARGAADANGSGETSLTVGLYRNTTAITSLQVISYTNLVAGSTIELFGVRTVNQ